MPGFEPEQLLLKAPHHLPHRGDEVKHLQGVPKAENVLQTAEE